jgi:hypothetical protein
MKDYGKRIIPKNWSEFADLVLPFVLNGDVDMAVDVLNRYSKKKKKNPKKHFETSPMLVYMAFHHSLHISIQTLCNYFLVFITGVPDELDEQVNAIAEEELINRFGSAQNFLKTYLKDIKARPLPVVCLIETLHHPITELSPLNSDYGFYSKSWQFGIKNDRPDICGQYLIESALKDILHYAHGHVRELNGLKPHRSKWINEQLLFDRIKLTFTNTTVIGQGSPHWLDGQRFDIWLPEHSIAIEYNGKQHYQPVNFFGGEEGLKKTKERDALKKQKCIDNSTHLFILDEDYDFEFLVEEIRKLI